jgi:hypothetical protein
MTRGSGVKAFECVKKVANLGNLLSKAKYHERWWCYDVGEWQYIEQSWKWNDTMTSSPC